MSIAIRFDSAARSTAAAARFGYGLHHSVAAYTKTDDAWHLGYTLTIESDGEIVHPSNKYTKAERDAFYAGSTEACRELEHQQEQARLATCGDVVAISNRDDRDEARGGWGHAANEFEAMAEAV